MLYLESFDELLGVLKTAAYEEDCKHASYVSSTDDITMLLEVVNKNTNAIPEFINFNNLMGEGCEYYTFSFDYDEDEELSYSITPSVDENGRFFPDFGFCLIDECVPKDFERDYKKGSLFDDYEKPIRVYWGEEPKEDDKIDTDCKKCTYDCNAPCCSKNKMNEAEEKIQIDTDDNGKVRGFSKSWKDKNSFFKYSYYSTKEDDILNQMKKLNINRFK